MSESEDERRRGERVPINDEFAGLAGTTWVSDLSLGGVFVHTHELLPVGAMVDLRFTILLDDPVVIEAVGKVVRHSHKPRGMGVQFAALSPEMTSRIEEVISRRRPLDSGTPLRLPEPSREPIGLPDDDDEDEDDPTARRLVFARPAPVEGLGLRRLHKQEFEDAVTASFPKLDTAKTGVFSAVRSPSRPQPRAKAREIEDEDRTRVYKAVPTDDEPS